MKMQLGLSVVALWLGIGIASAEDLSTQIVRATCKIAGGNSAATAFLLRRVAADPAPPRQFALITGAHVFDSMPGEQATLVWRQKEPDGSYKKLPINVPIRKEGKALWVKHPSADVAALLVELPENADQPTVSADLLATDEMLQQAAVHPGDELRFLGFPHQFEASPAGFGVLRRGEISSYPLLPTKTVKTFLAGVNVFEGDSGGPVYMAEANRVIEGNPQPQNTRLILGLVSGQHFLDEDIKTPYEIRKVRHRLGLAIIVHATSIRETLELLNPPAPKPAGQ